MPDLLYIDKADPSQNFVAEIGTISDKGRHSKNPVTAFQEKLGLRAKEFGIPDTFSIEVASKERKQRKSKIELRLPPEDELDHFITTELESFFNKIADNPEKKHFHQVRSEKANLDLKYDSKAEFLTTHHSSYTDEKTLGDALRKKRKQLINSGYDYPKGIIICDGDSNILRTSIGLMPGEVICRFLASHPDIAFVLVCSVVDATGYPDNVELQVKLHKGSSFRHLGKDVQMCLEEIKTGFPEPERTPGNALSYLRSNNPLLGSAQGGGPIGGDSFSISSRVLMHLIAGKIDSKQFIVGHKFHSDTMRRWIEEGRLIDRIEIETSDEDDDLIVFSASKPDPAISPFTISEIP